MQTIVVYGASDDLVEVESENAQLAAEFDIGSGDAKMVVVRTSNTVDVFAVTYTRGGVWRVTHKEVSGSLSVDIVKGPEDDEDDEDESGYTDRATIQGEIISVEGWESWPPSIHELREQVEELMETRLSYLTAEDLLAIIKVTSR